MNAEVRNTSKYLDFQNAKDISKERELLTQAYGFFTSRQHSVFSATVLEQGMDRRGMAGTLISFLEILR